MPIPCRMAHSSYTWRDTFAQAWVPGHAADGTPRPSRHFQVPVAATTLYTTAADCGRFVAAWLEDTRLAATSTGSAVPVDASSGLRWGLGWGLEGDGADTVAWHWGNVPGYRSLVLASPAAGWGIVVLTDGDEVDFRMLQ